MTTIKQADLITSVADALQYISYYHPKDYIEHLGRAYELRSDLPRARNAYERALELVPEDGPEGTELRAAIAAIGRVGTGR